MDCVTENKDIQPRITRIFKKVRREFKKFSHRGHREGSLKRNSKSKTRNPKQTFTFMKKYILQPLGRIFRQRAFLVCVLLMAVLASGMHVAANKLKMHFRKEPIELRKPLDDLSKSKLYPYRVINEQKIKNKEVEEELGTKDYIQWVLEDTSVEKSDPSRLAMLFVTYYTGNPDKVPHVPDWCYTGGGGIIEDKRNARITVPDIGLEKDDDQLGVRVLDISVPDGISGRRQNWVVYFFGVNGQYRCERNAVRILQNNWQDKYAYFSKVELLIGGEQKISYEQVLAAAEKLSRVVVPLLYSEHWPDWEELGRGENDE